jgi:hypothetical protein
MATRGNAPRPGRKIPPADPTHLARTRRVRDVPTSPDPTDIPTAPTPIGNRSRDGRLDDNQEKHIISIFDGYKQEAEDAKKTRQDLTRRNLDAYMNRQDWSYKQEGQSTEFLPKISTSAEQFGAFVKRSLIQFGDWFSVELSPKTRPVLTDGQIRDLLEFFFATIPDGVNKTIELETVVSDMCKAALMESLMVFKVHGQDLMAKRFSVEPGTEIISMATKQRRQGPPRLGINEKRTWRLRVDGIRTEDYYPDPTGRGLYEIHEVERDFHEIIDMVEAGIYDSDVAEKLERDFQKKRETKRPEYQRGQDEAKSSKYRRRVVLEELWGTILDEDGRKLHPNCVATRANYKYLIRKPEDNPFWHQRSPFIACPLIRVPHSVWHKALYDSASDLNLALNEMFNLMLDGGIAAVWGIKQIRANHLEDTSQVSGGIPQGITLVVKDTLPAGAKVLETVAEGSVPSDAMAVYEMLAREFTQAALTNEIKLGALPPRQVLATEVNQADQSQAVTLDSISADVERMGIKRVIELSWLTVLQHIKRVDPDEIAGLLGPDVANVLTSFSEAEIFAALAGTANFKVFGLSATLTRVRDFQRTMGLMQVVGSNPMLMQAFFRDYSERKLLKQAMKMLNINPDDLARTPQENEELPQVLQQMMMFAQMMSQASGKQGTDLGATNQGQNQGEGNGIAKPGGQDQGGIPSQISQEANPLTGMQQ